MGWRYTYDTTLQVVEVVYAGETTDRDLRDSTSAFISLEKEKGVNRFLVDATEMKLAFSLADIYDLPTKQYVDQKADRQGCVAVILPNSRESKQAVRFYENVCRNRGWMVQAFSDREAAKAWLAGIGSSEKPDKSGGS